MPDITALTKTPVSPPGSLPNTDLTGWLLACAIAGVTSLMWLRRRYSRDNAEMLKDRTEGTLLQIALAERDKAMTEAREAWDRRTQDAMEIAGLRAKNEFLQGEVNRLRQDLSQVHVQLGQVLEAMRRLNPEFNLVPLSD